LTVRSIHIALATAFLIGGMAGAQDTTSRGVRIGLTYTPGTKPGVVILPIAGAGGDSVRAVLARDFDFSDRIEVIGREGTSAFNAAQGAGSTVNYSLWKTLGAAAVVQATMTGGGVHLALHDVARNAVLQLRDFALPPYAASDDWRAAVHGVSDEVERWITGTRGIAQTRILYVRAGRVYVTDSDGHGERALTDGGGALSPAWHPGGRMVAYSVFGSRGTEIVVRDLLSGRARTVSATPGGLNITPEFSPDGRSLVYAHGQESGTDLYIVPVDGGPARRITVGRGTDNVSPSFSPDGRRLAFTSGRSGHPEVYTGDVDGTNAELLTPFNFGDQNYRSNPAWAPDGRMIAFQSQIGGRFQIMTINLRDRGIRQLTSDGRNEDASWAPDSRHLVFTSNRSGVPQLFVLDVESGRTRQLTRGGGSRLAAWSRHLASASP
jgi:TolB protein